MTTNPLLGLDVYVALAAVGWADGQLTREAEEGIELERLSKIEEAVQKPVDVGVVDRMNMSKSDRLYVYAVASWIAALDGPATEKEQEALDKLGLALGVPEPPRRHADEIMREIAAQDSRPERFDLRALRKTLDEQLEAARAARLAQEAADSGGSES
jgi:hypothetical protein